MPTLHLPAAHTDADLALAIEVGEVVGSHELYVSWTHGEGAGLPPEIETTFGERSEPAPSALAEVIVAMVQGISALWKAIAHPPSTKPALPAPRPTGEARSTADEPRA